MLSDEEPTFHRLDDTEIKTHTQKNRSTCFFFRKLKLNSMVNVDTEREKMVLLSNKWMGNIEYMERTATKTITYI